MNSYGNKEPRVMEKMSRVVPGQERGFFSLIRVSNRWKTESNPQVIISFLTAITNRTDSSPPTFTDHFSPHGTSHSSVDKPCFTHLLRHNKPSPNSGALSSSSLSCLTVLELTRLCQAFSHLGFLIPHASLMHVRWQLGPDSSQVYSGAGHLIPHVPDASGGRNN